MLGARRASMATVLLVAGLVGAGLVGGCSAVQGGAAPSTLLPAGPATAPPAESAPVGTVSELDGSATAMVFDPGTGILVVALTDPPRLMLSTLDAAASQSARLAQREVPLPGPASDLALAAAGGPLLVPVAEPGALLRVPLDGGTPSRTDLDGSPRAAATVGEHTVVAAGDRLAVLDGEGPPRIVPGFVNATRLAPFGAKVAVLDQGRVAMNLVDPASGQVGPALRGGLGAVDMVPDRFDRLLVTDVRNGEFLVFAGDPLLLRQRYPLPGSPYAVAYDDRRDLAWVSLTARNEVVGLDVAGGEPVIVHRFPTVHQPDAVAVDPAGGRVIVASASGAGLQVIDPERVVN